MIFTAHHAAVLAGRRPRHHAMPDKPGLLRWIADAIRASRQHKVDGSVAGYPIGQYEPNGRERRLMDALRYPML